MKKLIKKLNFAIIGIMASAPAMAAANINNAICELAKQFRPIFSAFRTLAFIGAGITIAGWAYGWIKEGDKFKAEDAGKKGFGMLIGFVVLFALGGIVTAFMSMTDAGGSLGCDIGTEFFG